MAKRRGLRIILWTACAGVVLTLGALSWRPEWIVLVAPGVRVSSTYCSRWKAAGDERILLAQGAAAQRIGAGSSMLRTDGKLELWRTPQGEFWIPGGSSTVLFTLLAQQERMIYGTVPKGGTVIDCGAHVGVFTKAALARQAAHVVAVEPAPDALECFRRNLKAEIADGRVAIVPKGIWDKDGELTFFLNGNGDAADSFVTHGDGSKKTVVPVTTLDTILAEQKLSSVELVKMDVKGATSRALAGGKVLIARFHPHLALATEEPPEDPASLTAQVQEFKAGYTAICGPCFLIEKEVRTDVMFYQ
ncbi:MAG: FkbM family methyltransferase [Paludibaculum sp.]